ncbi:(Fe-S)-binding protein [Flammeovirgaceae bacterium SG7u.111]|nr:(Fe-S)-binding protein [Flammeovirgaceae bacterium SG7u.132]WPO33827.1 (Fe-S)-binding protein [Flammeovirgaceae bacterium SG7u.111]
MKVGLFVPCYIDQFYPNVAVSTLQLLEKLGMDVEFPLNQTCCGQPMANSGCEDDAEKTAALFVKNFKDCEYIVCPSGSCTLHVRDHYKHFTMDAAERKTCENTYELCEFLVKVLKIEKLESNFPHKVGLHLSCHGLRGMRLGKPSETVEEDFSFMRDLLDMVKGIELVELARKDECCGFGGTFAVSEEAVSVKMGTDRTRDHIQSGAEVITGGDMSCLMHMEGLLNRQKQPVKVMHIAEILNGNRG